MMPSTPEESSCRPEAALLLTVQGKLALTTLLAILGAVLLGCATAPTSQSSPTDCTRAVASESENLHRPVATRETAGRPNAVTRVDEFGLQVIAVRLSANGYMIDFRYRILDPAKAKPFMDRSAKPQVISQKTGAVMFVPTSPKVGALRQTSRNPDTARTYFIMFANPGRHIKTGDEVTVAVGDCRIENLVVQ